MYISFYYKKFDFMKNIFKKDLKVSVAFHMVICFIFAEMYALLFKRDIVTKTTTKNGLVKSEHFASKVKHKIWVSTQIFGMRYEVRTRKRNLWVGLAVLLRSNE